MALFLSTVTFASAQSNSTDTQSNVTAILSNATTTSSNTTTQLNNFSVKFASSFGSGNTINLHSPQGIAVDNSGNMYVTDNDNNRIVKFDSKANFLETIGSTGSGDGQLLSPTGIAVDKSGNIYVVDFGNYRIEKFDPSGNFMLKFSSNIGVRVSDPEGVAVDDSGNIYVADLYNPIEKFDPNGNLISTIGTYEIGGAQGVVLDKSGNIFVLNNEHPDVVEFSSGGTFIKEWGSLCQIKTNAWCTDPDGAGPFESGDGQFYDATGITIDDAGNIYVADLENSRIQIFDPSGHFFYKLHLDDMGQANTVAIYNGNMYVVGSQKNQVQVFGITYGNATSAPNVVSTSPTMYSYTPQDGPSVPKVALPITSTPPTTGDITPGYVTAFGSEGSKNGQLAAPQGIALDSTGNIYVADMLNNRVEKFDSTGNFISTIGSVGSADGQFSDPTSVAVDKSGNLYVTDLNNYRIEKFNPSGNFILKFGTRGDGDGQFQNPRGMAFDASGNLYVADLIHPIQKFDPSGNFISHIGEGTINGAQGIAIDKSGNIYVLDNGSPQVVEFSSDGTFVKKWGSKCDMYDTTLGGCIDPDGSGPLALGDGQFLETGGIAVDKSGNIFVTDIADRVEVFYPPGHFIYKFGSSGTYGGQFANPIGITIDDSGNLYVVDQHNGRVQTFNVNNMNIAGLSSNVITPSSTTITATTQSSTSSTTPQVTQSSTPQVMPQIAVTSVPTLSSMPSTIPVWVKGIFNYYGQGQMSDNELINAINFLVRQGIVKLK